MKIVFFGSAQFAVPSLKALIASGHKIFCVVTQPDRRKGRGLLLESTAIKKVASEAGLKIYEPLKANSPESLQYLKGLNADLYVVIAYGQILSKEILEIPSIFSINIHASLLPEYRGAAPINWVLINGESTTGLTVIKMTENMDAGPIILQESTAITPQETALRLEERLSKNAAELLMRTISVIKENNYKLIAQDENKVSFAPKLKKDHGMINWNKPAQVIYNLIRGCEGWPGAITFYNGKLLKIHTASVLQSVISRSERQNGRIAEILKDGIVVNTADGDLKIEELQIEGKRRIKANDFICGHKIYIGEILGKK